MYRAFLFLSLLSGSCLAAGDAASLERLGAKVKLSGGVVAQAVVKCDGFSDADFQTLGSCTTLKDLTISGRALNDRTLGLLAGLTELERLSTDGMQLTDEGFRHFRAFKKLKSLSLFHPAFRSAEFTGSGLAVLKDLPLLERLTFAGSTAGDEALAAVGEITQLKDFRTWHTAQTQAGNAHLLKLKNLTGLRIGQRLPNGGGAVPPSFDASTLEVIGQMKTLESLELTEARLGAGIVPHLKALPKLARLKFESVDISEADLEAVRAALLGCRVEHKPMSEEEKQALLVKKLRL